MAVTLNWMCVMGAVFFFGVAATIKLLTWILVRNSEYDGGEGCLGNFISSIAVLAGVYLIYLSITGF